MDFFQFFSRSRSMALSIYDTFFDWGAYVRTVKMIQKGK